MLNQFTAVTSMLIAFQIYINYISVTGVQYCMHVLWLLKWNNAGHYVSTHSLKNNEYKCNPVGFEPRTSINRPVLYHWVTMPVSLNGKNYKGHLFNSAPCTQRLISQIQRGIFQIPDSWEGSFPELLNFLIHEIWTLNHHWDIFTQLGPFHYTYIAFWNFEGNMRETSMRKYPGGFYRERRWKYPHRKFSFISPEFPLGNYEELSTGMIPWNSPINPRGNFGGCGWLARWEGFFMKAGLQAKVMARHV